MRAGRKSRSPRASPTRRGRARANSGKSTGVVEEEEEATPAASTRSRASSNASTGSTGAHTTLDTDTHKALEPDAMQTKVSTQLLPLPLVVAVGLLATAANLFLVAGKDFYMLKQPGKDAACGDCRACRDSTASASLCFDVRLQATRIAGHMNAAQEWLLRSASFTRLFASPTTQAPGA